MGGFLEQLLPAGVSSENLRRHLHFLTYYLERGEPQHCRRDIDQICQVDVPKLEKTLQTQHYDVEFATKLAPLLTAGHWDSAVRKGCVLLKERLVQVFDLASEKDGADLVNAAFKQGPLAGKILEAERQAMRDLLAGLYGTFRNRYSHADIDPAWFEAAAVLGMINWALRAIDGDALTLADPPSL